MKAKDKAELTAKAHVEFHNAAMEYTKALAIITDGNPIQMSAILWRTFVDVQSKIVKCLDKYIEHVVSEREKGGNDGEE